MSAPRQIPPPDPPELWVGVTLGSLLIHAAGLWVFLGEAQRQQNQPQSQVTIPVELVTVAPNLSSGTVTSPPRVETPATPKTSPTPTKQLPTLPATPQQQTPSPSPSPTESSPSPSPTNPTPQPTTSPPSSPGESNSQGNQGFLVRVNQLTPAAGPGGKPVDIITNPAQLKPGSSQNLTAQELENLGVELGGVVKLDVAIVVEENGKVTFLEGTTKVLQGNLSRAAGEKIARQILAGWEFTPTEVEGEVIPYPYRLTLTLDPN